MKSDQSKYSNMLLFPVYALVVAYAIASHIKPSTFKRKIVANEKVVTPGEEEEEGGGYDFELFKRTEPLPADVSFADPTTTKSDDPDSSIDAGAWNTVVAKTEESDPNINLNAKSFTLRSESNMDTLGFHSNHNMSPLDAISAVNVAGISINGGAPSDACGAVGPNNYVQAVNDQYAIFDKSGNMLAGYPKDGSALYASFNDGTAGATACRTATNGDPVVQYDKLANRWIFTEFAWLSANSDSGPFYQVMNRFCCY